MTQVQSIQTQLNQLETQVNAGSGSGVVANAKSARRTPTQGLRTILRNS